MAANTPETSLKPTRKWIAAAVVGVVTILVHTVASGGWDATEWAEVLTLATGLAAGYVQTNDPTPGGVPVK
jgi:hypothetical protein